MNLKEYFQKNKSKIIETLISLALIIIIATILVHYFSGSETLLEYERNLLNGH